MSAIPSRPYRQTSGSHNRMDAGVAVEVVVGVGVAVGVLGVVLGVGVAPPARTTAL